MQTSVVSAYVIGIVVFIVMLLLAAIVANAIAFESGTKPKDPRKRKMWFWILGILTPLFTFLLAYFIFYSDIRMENVKEKYMTAMFFSMVLSFVLYVVMGYILSRVFNHGKLKSWF